MLQVLFANQRVGLLWNQSRKLHFQYANEWLETAGAFSLSPYIPLDNSLYQGDVLLYFFSNLLPEGHVLDAILKLKRLPRGSVYAQLEAFGEDAAGAFSVVPDGELPQRYSSYEPYTAGHIRADLARLGERMPLLLQHGDLRLSLAGSQNKIPVRYRRSRFSLPKGGASSTHILKPSIQPARYFQYSVQNEAVCLQLAGRCGIKTAHVDLVYLPEPVLVVERYDRIIEEGKVSRLHQLDFCQLAQVLPDQKYEKNGGPGLQQLFELIDRWSLVPARDRLQVLDWLLFNYLVGNADAHAKNISMLVLGRQHFELAPTYDVLCTKLYPELRTEMAMSIAGEYRPERLTSHHWQQLAQSVGVNWVLFCKRAKHLMQRMEMMLPMAARQLGLNEHPIVERIARVLQQRSRFLQACVTT